MAHERHQQPSGEVVGNQATIFQTEKAIQKRTGKGPQQMAVQLSQTSVGTHQRAATFTTCSKPCVHRDMQTWGTPLSKETNMKGLSEDSKLLCWFTRNYRPV